MAVRADGGPQRVAFAASALGVTADVVNGAIQQRAAKNIGQTGESGGELIWTLELSKTEFSTLLDGRFTLPLSEDPRRALSG
jgi:hypothetical protein